MGVHHGAQSNSSEKQVRHTQSDVSGSYNLSADMHTTVAYITNNVYKLDFARIDVNKRKCIHILERLPVGVKKIELENENTKK